MANTVKLKKSAVPGKVPLDTDLQHGELAINYADGKIYYKDVNNHVQYITTGGGSSGGGGGGVIISDSAPTDPEPVPGALWFDTRSATLKIFFYDNSSFQWVEVNSGLSLPDFDRSSDINFPAAPTLNQKFTQSGKSWKWDGISWIPDNQVKVNTLADETIDYINNTSIVYAIALG